MADRVNPQRSGWHTRQPTRFPERLGQFIQPKPNGSTSSGSAPSTGHGSYSLAPLRRLAPQQAPAPRSPSPPPVRIPPIRRMAPQRQTAKRPAWQNPLLKPPTARRERKMAFVTSQTSLFPMILSGPEAEMDQSVARPRELKPVPPVTRSAPSSRNSAATISTDIPPPTPPKSNDPMYHSGLSGPSSTSFPLASPPTMDVVSQLPSIEALMYTTIPPAVPVHPQIQMGPQSPLRAFAPQITPNKPVPQLPQTNCSKLLARLPQNAALVENHPRQYRPRTPPPSSFVSQSQMAADCRSASLPAIPRVSEESLAAHSVTVKIFQDHPTNASKEIATKNALTPVKFVDYTQIASFPYTIFPNVAEGNLSKIHPLDTVTPFGQPEAKVFVLKLLPALQYLKENRIATPTETLACTELTQITEDWLLTTEVTRWPKFAGTHYGMLLFAEAKALNDNWFVVAGLPKFLWSKWTLPCTEIRGHKLSWEWYLTVQDVFFGGILQAYTEGVRESYVVVGDVAYPMNTIVPRSIAPEMRGRAL